MFSVSIVTVCRNAEATIADCLESVASQTQRAEHIVIDAVSSDSTLSVIEAYRREGLKVISEPDQGMYDGLNKGIANATGEIVGVLHADDFYASNRVIERVVTEMDALGADTCYGDLEYVDQVEPAKVTRRWRSGEFDRARFLWGWMPPHPTFFVRRKAYEEFGGFRLDLGTAADYELMLRFLFKERLSAAYVPETLIRMRVGGVSNRSLGARLQANRMDRLAWSKNGLRPYPWTIPCKPLRKLVQWL